MKKYLLGLLAVAGLAAAAGNVSADDWHGGRPGGHAPQRGWHDNRGGHNWHGPVAYYRPAPYRYYRPAPVAYYRPAYYRPVAYYPAPYYAQPGLALSFNIR
ncbi:MAG TPA: hypothetical protein VHP58_00870 [Alphaproteobacteria bacterium]|nr:hypothetical protein [Alphaproteobacteria bacterium]